MFDDRSGSNSSTRRPTRPARRFTSTAPHLRLHDIDWSVPGLTPSRGRGVSVSSEPKTLGQSAKARLVVMTTLRRPWREARTFNWSSRRGARTEPSPPRQRKMRVAGADGSPVVTAKQ
jgi:hypothetical protein